MARYVVRIRVMRNAYSILVGKPEGKRPLTRPRHRWENDIKMDGGKVWTGCIWLRTGGQWRAVVKTVMNLRVL